MPLGFQGYAALLRSLRSSWQNAHQKSCPRYCPHRALNDICDSLAFLERYRKYENDNEYLEQLIAEYDDRVVQMIDIFQDFRMRLKSDKKTGKVMFGAEVQSVFDICWYTFSRMVADVAPPVDQDLDYFESQGPILSCLACGKYFVRHSSRQLYCDSWDCQTERNRKNRRSSYAWKKAAEAANNE